MICPLNIFWDLNPKNDDINSSLLTKFIKLGLKDTDLLNLVINKTVTIAIAKSIICLKSIIFDTIHILYQDPIPIAIEVLKERSLLPPKTVYTFDDQFKERMPQKNTNNDLEKEQAYCKELETLIENEPSISAIPAVKEKLNLLKEPVEDTQENCILSKDTDAKTGHKAETI